MTGLVDRLLGYTGPILYLVVALFVFAEDALFVGFVIPGETAAVLGGVVVSRGSASLPVMIITVIAAAIVGDTVGYEVGRRLGPRILKVKFLYRRRGRLDDAQDLLRRRGAVAVFLGRFLAFFRAVMPALAGTARMPYRRFLISNAAGGIVWGAMFVLLGYLGGNAYQRAEQTVGRGATISVVAAVVIAFVVWRIRNRQKGPKRPRPPLIG